MLAREEGGGAGEEKERVVKREREKEKRRAFISNSLLFRLIVRLRFFVAVQMPGISNSGGTAAHVYILFLHCLPRPRQPTPITPSLTQFGGRAQACSTYPAVTLVEMAPFPACIEIASDKPSDAVERLFNTTGNFLMLC